MKLTLKSLMIKKAKLNLNIYTSYFSHAVNYSHEYLTFWYVWNLRTTNFEILIGSSFCHTCEEFVRIVHTCDKYVWIFHMCDRFVRMWK